MSADSIKQLERKMREDARRQVVHGLLAILTCPSYDPTVEGPALLKVLDEVSKTGHFKILELASNLGAKELTGLESKRDFAAETRTLLTQLFPLGVNSTAAYGESIDFPPDVDGQEDPPGDIYAEAASKIPDAPLNEGDRVTGKPEGLGAPYGESPPPYTELQFTTDYNAILDYAHSAGIILSCAKQNELRIVLRGVLETGKPAKFEPGNGDVLVLGAKASDHKEFAEFAVAAKRDHHLGLLLKRLLN